MKLNLYLAIVTDRKGNPYAAPLLAADRVHAMSRVIDRCKAELGMGSKVGPITHLGEADLPTMKRTQLLKVLSKFDQIAFTALELEKQMKQCKKLLQDLQIYVKTLQTKLEN